MLIPKPLALLLAYIMSWVVFFYSYVWMTTVAAAV
jgi:hypothetical protein